MAACRRIGEWGIRKVGVKVEVTERIFVPPDIEAAREKQAEIANEFERCFAKGLTVVGVDRSTYLLGMLP